MHTCTHTLHREHVHSTYSIYPFFQLSLLERDERKEKWEAGNLTPIYQKAGIPAIAGKLASLVL